MLGYALFLFALSVVLHCDALLAQAFITKYQRLGRLSKKHLFLTVLEAGSPSSTCLLIHFLVRAPFLTYCQLVSHWVPRETGVFLFS